MVIAARFFRKWFPSAPERLRSVLESLEEFRAIPDDEKTLAIQYYDGKKTSSLTWWIGEGVVFLFSWFLVDSLLDFRQILLRNNLRWWVVGIVLGLFLVLAYQIEKIVKEYKIKRHFRMYLEEYNAL